MSKKNVHVLPHPNGGWGPKKSGNERFSSVHQTQKEAKEAGRLLAIQQQSELLVHRPNGQIREKLSYGNDPFPPKG